MRPSLQFFIDKFKYYNDLCFNGMLPLPPIRLNTRLGALGITKCKIVSNLDGTYLASDFIIEFSVRLDLPENEYLDTIVHEMIHYYIFFNGLVDDSSHGKVFHSIVKELGEKYGVLVSLYYNPSIDELIERRDHTRFICVTELDDGILYVGVFAKNKIFQIWEEIKNNSRVKQFTWYASNRAIWGTMPTLVSIKLKPMEARVISQYLTGAVELEKIGNLIKKRD